MPRALAALLVGAAVEAASRGIASILARRRAIYAGYQELLQNLPGIGVQPFRLTFQREDDYVLVQGVKGFDAPAH